MISKGHNGRLSNNRADLLEEGFSVALRIVLKVAAQLDN